MYSFSMRNMKEIICVLPLIFMCSGLESVQYSQDFNAKEFKEENQEPVPYSYTYVAGRFPGHVDRVHSETSDGNGVVKGSFSYLDPLYQIRSVDYVADKQGFHPVLSNPVADTPTVAAAKQRHADLFQRIALEHAKIAAEREALTTTHDPNIIHE